MNRPFMGFKLALAAAALMVAGTTETSAQSMGYPDKGKTITFIVPWGAGGGSDTSARLLVPSMEKTLGVKIQVLNKPGGGSQLGITALAQTKPDGYTIGLLSMPAGMTVYLDPDRKARFSRKDLAPVALMNVDPQAVVVGPGSPYKTLEDLVGAAKAQPNTIRASITGLISDTHLGALMFMKATGTELRLVNFAKGTVESLPALLGGHVDVSFGVAGSHGALHKSGEVRILGMMDNQRSSFFPNVPTLEEKGYKVYMAASRGVAVPAGVPNEIVKILADSVKQAMDEEAVKKRMAAKFVAPRYMGASAFGEYWDQLESMVKPLVEVAKKK
jgi:tripartite-type tricarboxylate transporter receptor subunit TctC